MILNKNLISSDSQDVGKTFKRAPFNRVSAQLGVERKCGCCRFSRRHDQDQKTVQTLTESEI